LRFTVHSELKLTINLGSAEAIETDQDSKEIVGAPIGLSTVPSKEAAIALNLPTQTTIQRKQIMIYETNANADQ
jgi:hypothetical protein